ncbi:hypothetical protein ECANGB1_233 [Enterospora canceri]|uniref:RRM domain-containing protein n=1 Tax=Enterospora canceri TaxID=1081671 RepID=A0A1Y1S8A8_9MICR|nr:hypothetical protein ECANGB1_233 [Enterospora canceri]
MPIKNLPSLRTILVTNFRNEDEFRRFKQVLPEQIIYEHYTISNFMNLFITFFDIRDSISFYQKFRDPRSRREIKGVEENSGDSFSELEFTFTISRNEMQKGNEEVQFKNNQSSVIVYFKNVDFDCSDQMVIKYMQQFGEIKDIRLSKPQQKIMEFYDFRDARKAVSQLDNATFGTGFIRIKFVWDTMMNYKIEFVKRTDGLLRATAEESSIRIEPAKKQKMDEKESRVDMEFIQPTTRAIKHNPDVYAYYNVLDEFIVRHLDEIEAQIKGRQ